MPLDRSWDPLSANPDHHPQKTNRSARRCIWRYCFQAGVWNWQILNQVVESQLFTSLWNRFHQQLSDLELIQISAFLSFLFLDQPLFHCWKASRGLKLSRNSFTPENDRFKSIVYMTGTAWFPPILIWINAMSKLRRVGCRESLARRFATPFGASGRISESFQLFISFPRSLGLALAAPSLFGYVFNWDPVCVVCSCSILSMMPLLHETRYFRLSFIFAQHSSDTVSLAFASREATKYTPAPRVD